MKSKPFLCVVFSLFTFLPVVSWGLSAQTYDSTWPKDAIIQPSSFVEVKYKRNPNSGLFARTGLVFDSKQVVLNYDTKGQALTGYNEFAVIPPLKSNYQKPINAAGNIVVEGTYIADGAQKLSISLAGANLKTLRYPSVHVPTTVTPEEVYDGFNFTSSNNTVQSVLEGANTSPLWVYAYGVAAVNDPKVRLVWPGTFGKYYRVTARAQYSDGSFKESNNVSDVYFDGVRSGFCALNYSCDFSPNSSPPSKVTYIVKELNSVGDVSAWWSKVINCNEALPSAVKDRGGFESKTAIDDFTCTIENDRANLTVRASLPAQSSKSYKVRFFRSTQPAFVKQNILELAGFDKVDSEIMLTTRDQYVNGRDGLQVDQGGVESDMVKVLKTHVDNFPLEPGRTYYYRAILTAYDVSTGADPVVRVYGENLIATNVSSRTPVNVVAVSIEDTDLSGLGREIRNKQAFVGFAFDRDLVVKDGLSDRNRWFATEAGTNVVFNDLLSLLGNKTNIRVGGKFTDHFQGSVDENRSLSNASVTAFLETIKLNGGGSFGLPTVRLKVLNPDTREESDLKTEDNDSYISRITKEVKIVTDLKSADFTHSLLKWELGNEPDWQVQESGYGNILDFPNDYGEYKNDISLVKTAIGKMTDSYGARLQHPFVGPSSASHDEKSLHDWTLRAPRDWELSETTLHYYWRNSQHFAYLTTANLLSADPSLHNALSALEQTGGKFRFNEAATGFSGGARGFADTHASGLWAVNFMLLSASYGAEGINFQSGYTPGTGFNTRASTYSPFYSEDKSIIEVGVSGKKRYVTQINPTFLAMYAISKALTPSNDSQRVFIKKLNVVPVTAGYSIASYSKPNPSATGKKLNFDTYKISHNDSDVLVLVNNEELTTVSCDIGSFGSSYTLMKLTPTLGCSLSSKTTPQSLASKINDIDYVHVDGRVSKQFINNIHISGGFGAPLSRTSILSVPPGSAYFLKFATDGKRSEPTSDPISAIFTDNVKFSFADYTPEFSIYVNKPGIQNAGSSNADSALNVTSDLRSKITKYTLLYNEGILFNGFNKLETQRFCGSGEPFGVKQGSSFFAPLKGTGAAFVPNVVTTGQNSIAEFRLNSGVPHFINLVLLPPFARQNMRTPVSFSGKGTVRLNARNNLKGGIIVKDGATLMVASPALNFFSSNVTNATPILIRNPEFYLGDGNIVLGVTGGQADQGGVLDLNKWPAFNKVIVVKGLGNVIQNGGLSPSAVIVLEENAQLTLNNVIGSGSLSGGGGSEIIYQGKVELSSVSAFIGTTFTPYNQVDALNRGVSLSIKGTLTVKQRNMFDRMKTVAGLVKGQSPVYVPAQVLPQVAAPSVAVSPVANSQTITYAGTLLVPDGSVDFPSPGGGTFTATYNKRTRQLDISCTLGAGGVTFPGSTVPTSWAGTVSSGRYQITYELRTIESSLILIGLLKIGGNHFASFYLDPSP
jgi:hypothetical protein